MFTLIRFSKLMFACSIAAFALFLSLQDRSPINFLGYSSKVISEIVLAHKEIIMISEQRHPIWTHMRSPSEDASNTIWFKIGEQLNLDHSTQNARVQTEIRKILADRKSFETILNHSAPYIYYIYTQTQQRHLPAELALIPIIESEYNPNDHNSIGATGLWQLMPATARGLGVSVDDRRNIIDSTNAALTYFSDLHKEFNGHWNLSFAAYNCGDYCVSSAVKRAGSNSYFDLRLPLETKIYVPRLLAIAEIIKHSKEYGVVLPQIKDAPFFTEVKVNKSESLSNYSKSTGTNLQLLEKLNPDYPSEKTHSLSSVLLVPVKSLSI